MVFCFDGGDDHVNAQSFDQKSQKGTEENRFSGEESADDHDQNIGQQQCFSDFDIRILLDDQCNDIRTTGAGIHIKHDAAGDGDDAGAFVNGILGAFARSLTETKTEETE